MCDHCLTAHENDEASTLQQQISSLTATVNTLAKEFKSFKFAIGKLGNTVSYNDKRKSKVSDLYLKNRPMAALFSKYKENL